jgi:hypothetical protein
VGHDAAENRKGKNEMGMEIYGLNPTGANGKEFACGSP